MFPVHQVLGCFLLTDPRPATNTFDTLSSTKVSGCRAHSSLCAGEGLSPQQAFSLCSATHRTWGTAWDELLGPAAPTSAFSGERFPSLLCVPHRSVVKREKAKRNTLRAGGMPCCALGACRTQPGQPCKGQVKKTRELGQ